MTTNSPDFDLHQALFANLDLQAFIDGLDWQEHQLTMYGKTHPVPRLLCMYGSAYNYSGVKHPAVTIPALLTPLRDHIQTMTGKPFNSVLGNLYRDGSDSVSWHSDDDYASGTQPSVVSLSLGATRRFRVRPKVNPNPGQPRPSQHFDLGHGDLLIMGDDAQTRFQHCVPKTSRKDIGPRVNLTFRYIEAPDP
ncbi:alpha-ketoglutarate-dependent dioxygenase AlkB [Deltaproteobacteria bacterium]|nr:alpha-ketoglutarate-dependent dioxygenase AlkB [Deltaproteobacteria bacterium]